MANLRLFGPLLVLGIVALIALLAPWIAQDPEAMDLANMSASPSFAHWLGTDELGRDTLTRLIHGGRVSLIVALSTAVVAAILGTFIGILAGYFRGWVDAILMRMTDGVISLPLLPLLIVLSAVDSNKLGLSPQIVDSDWFTIAKLVIIIALVGWTAVARLVRAQVLSVKERDFVRAAKALGVPDARILWRHILPNVTTPMVVATTLSVANIILIESALSFLGLGIQPPLASWGNMLNGAMAVVWAEPTQALWPGLMILIVVIAFNLLGEGLTQHFDPKRQNRR